MQRSEDISAALVLLRERKSLLARLDEGRRQLDRGEFTEYDEQGLKDYFDDVHRRGMERYERQNNGGP